MKNYTKQEILKIILSVVKEYDEKLNDKHFKITYQKGKGSTEDCSATISSKLVIWKLYDW